MSENIIRVAIGGQGRSGYNIHANWLRQDQEKYKIVAVADQLAERRKDAREEFGAKTFSDWKEMIREADFDLFVNALPSPLHVPGTIAALNADKHVICEKPMAPKVRDFDRMVAAAKKNQRVLAPFHNNRHQPFFEEMQKIIASGVLGKIVYIRSSWGAFSRRWDWQTWQGNMGGGLLNTGPHAIDQALLLYGWNRTPKVFCRMDCNNAFGADGDAHCTVTLFDPRRVAPQIDIIISGYLAYPQGDLYTVSGTYGGLAGGAKDLRWRYFDPAKAPDHERWNWSVDRKYPSEELPWEEHSWKLEEANRGTAVGYTLPSFQDGPAQIYQNVYDTIRKNGKLLVTPAQVRKQIAVLEECHRQNKLPKSK
ncbi:MAG: Gfo/Idh/MocA family oxidoreductase [Candidatus Latescibacteria bacterium]|nr:Gfo/Idh/MocA family oxidoreductase [Candidatus Latescibacterota bacterium]